jgi:glycosyltransferase involved in cell wall biosynthesis
MSGHTIPRMRGLAQERPAFLPELTGEVAVELPRAAGEHNGLPGIARIALPIGTDGRAQTAATTRHASPDVSCHLAVLVNEFPRLSETFVVGDLLGLEAAGVRLHIFSLRRPEMALAQEAVEDLRAPVEYLPEISGRQLSLLVRTIQAALFFRDPRRFSRGLAEIYTSPDYSRSRLQQALLLARRLDRIGSPPLYIHFAHKPATVGRFAALLLGSPFAISAHAVDVWTTPVPELHAKCRDAQLVLCCYEEALDYVRLIADGSARVELAPHGVVIPPQPVRAEQSPSVLLSVGRLVEKKGFDTLVRAARLLRDRGLQFQVRIVGEGPLWPALQRLVNELDLADTVRFLGPLTAQELEPQYAHAAVFALACRIGSDGNRDGLPNTVLEAMARGLPVVSTTLGSIEEAVTDGEQGLLAPADDHTALASALERLLNDRNLRSRLGAAARSRVLERYDRDRLASRVHTLLGSVGMIGAVRS